MKHILYKELWEYIIKSGATVRETAKRFGISKSTAHTVLH
ncbi:MAG: sporulation transcriptional regulator SpoIIID [Firmicutes bacterium]|nr:sporulation transcriptional regulator SpoIIID [Bacillota bacterium]